MPWKFREASVFHTAHAQKESPKVRMNFVVKPSGVDCVRGEFEVDISPQMPE